MGKFRPASESHCWMGKGDQKHQPHQMSNSEPVISSHLMISNPFLLFFFTWSVPATSHAGDIDHAIDDVGQYIVRVRERESYTCMYMCMDAIDGLSSG